LVLKEHELRHCFSRDFQCDFIQQPSINFLRKTTSRPLRCRNFSPIPVDLLQKASRLAAERFVASCETFHQSQLNNKTATVHIRSTNAAQAKLTAFQCHLAIYTPDVIDEFIRFINRQPIKARISTS